MNSSRLWHVFAETGDPLVYLLYRSAEDARTRSNEDIVTGPRL